VRGEVDESDLRALRIAARDVDEAGHLGALEASLRQVEDARDLGVAGSAKDQVAGSG